MPDAHDATRFDRPKYKEETACPPVMGAKKHNKHQQTSWKHLIFNNINKHVNEFP